MIHEVHEYQLFGCAIIVSILHEVQVKQTGSFWMCIYTGKHVHAVCNIHTYILLILAHCDTFKRI